MPKKKKIEAPQECVAVPVAPPTKVPPQLVAWQFRKGVKSLMRKKGVKQKAQEFLETCMDVVVPDEWLVNGLETMRGRGMTVQQVLLFRVMYNAITGTKNPGFKDAQELLNRLLGKVPLVVKHGSENDDDEFLELTDDQLNDEIAKLAETVRLKRLPAPKSEEKK